jgi:hypothetical protein
VEAILARECKIYLQHDNRKETAINMVHRPIVILLKQSDCRVESDTYRKIVEEFYNWDRIADQTIEVYRQILPFKTS